VQTKQQIQQLLARAGVEPNKRLGQHFLIDLNLMRYLLNCTALDRSDIALEVGCGTGSLTEAIAKKAGALIAVELDKTLAQITAEALCGAENVQVINADILSTKHQLDSDVVRAIQAARARYPGRLVLIANLPYNVAGALMLNLISPPLCADCMYVTVQKEVAQRMVASPGSSDYGVLSVLLSAVGKVKVLKTLKPGVFWPMPQVDSAMVSFVRITEKAQRIKDMAFFAALVNLFMQHRRKMFKGCVKFADGRLAQVTNWPGVFAKAGLDPCSRPGRAPAEKYIEIANLCFEQLTL